MELLRRLASLGEARGLISPFTSKSIEYHLIVGYNGARVEKLYDDPCLIQVPSEVVRVGLSLAACQGYDNLLYTTGFTEEEKRYQGPPRMLVFWYSLHDWVMAYGSDDQKELIAAFTRPLREIADAIVIWAEKGTREKRISSAWDAKAKVLRPACAEYLHEVLSGESKIILERILVSGPIFEGVWESLVDTKGKPLTSHLLITLDTGVDPTPLVQQEAYREGSRSAWLAELQGAATQTCLVSGEPCDAVRTHTPVKFIPSSDRVPFLSWKFDTYCYEGHSQGDNYPVSKSVHEAYTAAVSQFLMLPDGARYRNVVPVTSNVAAYLWHNDPQYDDAIETLMAVLDGFPEYRIWSTGSPERHAYQDKMWAAWDRLLTMEPPDFNVAVAVLRGSRGRVSVLHFEDIPFKVIQGRIRKLALGFQLNGYYQNFSVMTLLTDKLVGGFYSASESAPDASVIEAFLAVLLGSEATQTAKKHLQYKWMRDTIHSLNPLSSPVAFWKCALSESTPIQLRPDPMRTETVREKMTENFEAFRNASTEQDARVILLSQGLSGYDVHQCLNWWRSLEEPSMDSLVLPLGGRDETGYLLGRLVALDCQLRILRNVADHKQSSFRSALTHPGRYFTKSRAEANFSPKDGVSLSYRYFETMREDVLRRLGILDADSLTDSTHTVHYAQGYQVQLAYCQDYLTHVRIHKELKKNP